MPRTRQMTAIIERDGSGYVSLCPELDIASQGDTVEQARVNLTEALELFFEAADPSEVARRLRQEGPNHKELRPGTLQSIVRQSGLQRSVFEIG